jgi:hypothetical protein
LERGIGVHKNLLLAAQYYHSAAQQGHPDGANNFGICLEHGRGVQQNIQMAAQFYQFAADHGHSEAKLNHSRCLCLLGQWESPDHSSEIVSHSPSLDFLFDIFRGFLQNPEPLDDDGRRLLSSFQRLIAQTKIPIISDSSEVEWIPDEIGNGDSSVVKLSSDSKSKSHFMAIKTSQNPKCADLIRREASILKTLEHPLILQLRHYVSETETHNSVIVTEFVENGSLADHLPSTQSSDKCCLSGPNRIVRIIVSIALAMQYIHSRDVIHRDLRPENILLDWDWNVRIADFGHSISPDNPQPPSFFQDNPTGKWPSVDSFYLAPECYENS